MNNADNPFYILPLEDKVLSHYPMLITAVRDRARFRNPRLDALVRSKDYLIALATTLETISMDIEDDNPSAAQALDNLVYDLGYIEQHYALGKKPEAHNQ
jgi:hypothetical protein